MITKTFSQFDYYMQRQRYVYRKLEETLLFQTDDLGKQDNIFKIYIHIHDFKPVFCRVIWIRGCQFRLLMFHFFHVRRAAISNFFYSHDKTRCKRGHITHPSINSLYIDQTSFMESNTKYNYGVLMMVVSNI